MKPMSSLLMVFGLLFLLLGGKSQPVQSAPPPPDALQALQAMSGGQARVDLNQDTGLVRFIGADLDHAVPAQNSLSARGSAADAAMEFAREYAGLFGVSSPDATLQVEKAETSAEGQTFVRYQQTYQGIPVLGGELIVQLDAAQRLLSMSGEALDNIQVATTPAVEAAAAQQTALALTAREYGMPVESLQVGDTALWVYNPRLLGDPAIPVTRLVWRMDVSALGLDPVKELVLVDAQTGAVPLHFNQIDTLLSRKVYDNNNDSSKGLPGTSVARSEGGGASGVADVNYAYDFAGQTYNFYFTSFGRDSIDNAGMQLISTVRYCSPSSSCPYANAFWNGAQMVYGENYASGDDVVGHELTHGVTERTAHLFYYMQSGAINESLSDIFGEFVDQLNDSRHTDAPATKWRMGEDLPGSFLGVGLRDMKDPTTFSDADKMSSIYYRGGRYAGGSDDVGGVHHNSGILNKAAFLMVDGQMFNGQTVAPIGLAKTAQIVYKLQTNLLVSGSDYNDVFNLLPQACYSLVGSHGITTADCTQVVKAVTATEMNLTNPTYGPPAVPQVCTAGLSKVGLFSDGFEGTLANWTLVGGAWGFPPADFNYAKTGLQSLGADDSAIASADATAAMKTGVTIPSVAGQKTYLSFAHAFDLDSFGTTYYDGGVVEYSENGTTWLAMDALPVVNGPTATIESGFGNPLDGRTAFSGYSHGYQTTRYDLSSLAGKNVRFRWRLGVDSGFYVLGWFVDDVSVYTCKTLPEKIYLPSIVR